MREVVLYQLQSLDGVAEEPSDWMAGADETLFDFLRASIATQTDVLLGRGTYDYWAGHWPTVQDGPFAGFINATTKHVFTASPPAGDAWANTVFVDEPAAEYVARLREGDGGDIGIHGSIALAQSLLEADLVDRIQLIVAPTLAGGGRLGFDVSGAAGAGVRRLELVDTRADSDGQLLLTYRVTR